jgi:hypothetical protein
MPWLLDENSEELLNAAELLLGGVLLELLAAMLELLGLLLMVEDELGSSSSSTLEQENVNSIASTMPAANRKRLAFIKNLLLLWVSLVFFTRKDGGGG